MKSRVVAFALFLAASGSPILAQAAPAGMREAAALRDQGRFEEAAEAFETIVTANPTLPGPRFHFAYCVHESGDHERAIELHRTAAGFAGMRAPALYNLACALAMTGRKAEALDALSDAVAAGYADPAGARKDAELASIRDEPRFEEILGHAGASIRRALDFWVGEWDCYSAVGKQLNGHNVLESRLDGNAVHEHWTPAAGAGGSKGESWNYFDAASGRWKQNWIDANGNVTEFVGRRQGAGILFESSVGNGAGGTLLRRMFVRPVAGPAAQPRVQQTGTQSTDGGATWTPSYDLLYIPSGASIG
jgi:tetratricopeptide (TPR) repeat protein